MACKNMFYALLLFKLDAPQEPAAPIPILHLAVADDHQEQLRASDKVIPVIGIRLGTPFVPEMDSGPPRNFLVRHSLLAQHGVAGKPFFQVCAFGRAELLASRRVADRPGPITKPGPGDNQASGRIITGEYFYALWVRESVSEFYIPVDLPSIRLQGRGCGSYGFRSARSAIVSPLIALGAIRENAHAALAAIWGGADLQKISMILAVC